jgi:hypothetical protein
VCECNSINCDINFDLRPTLHLRRQGQELVGVIGQALLSADNLLTTLGEVRFHRVD